MSDPRQDGYSGTAVALDRVSFHYPGSAAGVQDISLGIAPGELVVCIGPSGCGKTTLLRLIAGFLKPESGTIRLKGNDVSVLVVHIWPLIVFTAVVGAIAIRNYRETLD